MNAAGFQRRRPHRQGDVDGILGEAADEVVFLEDGTARGESVADAVLEPVQRRAHDLAGFRRHGAERLQKLGDDALLAKSSDALGFERRLVGGGGDAGGDVRLEGRDFVVASFMAA